MFDNEQLGPEVLANPGSVQSLVIQEFQNRLNGTVSIADPNNAFCFVLEAGSSVLAQMVRLSEKQFEVLYPVRATTEEELYPHLSDFDYVNLTASPASVVFRLILDADWLTANAVVYDATYSKVIIPSSSVITLAGMSFSLYYPIDILINRTTGSILTTYDLSVANPLYTENSNFLNDVTEYSTAGLNLLALTFTAYQFATATYNEIATVGTGFNKEYTYTDQFYAARVFSQINNVWVECAYTLSQTIYDPTTPTVVLTVLADSQTLQVRIPQVYFTNGQIGQAIMIQIFTTQGSLNTAIAQSDAQAVTANFDTTSSVYSAILAQPPTLILAPYEQTQISGGSDAMTFAALRTAVINDTLYSTVPITPMELTAAAQKLGFSLTKYLDDITDRIYFATSTLVDDVSQILPPLGMLPTLIDLTAALNTSTILFYGDSSTTILPTTLFSFNPQSNLCVPLTNAEVTYIASLTPAALATALNTTIYTRQPYHVVVYSSETYPLTKSFDLTGPTTTGLTFITENTASPVQLTVASLNITHLQNGTGGYQIGVGVKRSLSLQSADPSTFYVIVSFTDRQGTALYLRAVYQSSTTSLDIYTVTFPTDYHLSQDLFIRTTLNTQQGIATLCEVALSSQVNFYLGVSAAANPGVSQSPTLQANAPALFPDMLAVSQQAATVTFGADLSGSIYNVTTSTWGPQAYATYPTTVYTTYAHDIYATNPNGTLVTTIVKNSAGANVVELTKLHSMGDQVLDSNGNPVVKYQAGALQLDANGNPIPLANRSVVYTIQMLQLNAILYSSNTTSDVNYVTGFTALIGTAVTSLAKLQNTLLERTALYYKPARTLGLATYGVGGGKTVQMSLSLSFAFTFYVPSSVLSDQDQLNTITTTTQQIVTKAVAGSVISLTEIAETLSTTFDVKVTSIDIGGINGNLSLQTLSLVDTDAVAAVGLNLTVGADGTLSLTPAITTTFVLSPNS